MQRLDNQEVLSEVTLSIYFNPGSTTNKLPLTDPMLTLAFSLGIIQLSLPGISPGMQRGDKRNFFEQLE